MFHNECCIKIQCLQPFYLNVSSVLSECCNYFYSSVAYGCNTFSCCRFFAIVLKVFSNYFSYFKRMLQIFSSSFSHMCPWMHMSRQLASALCEAEGARVLPRWFGAALQAQHGPHEKQHDFPSPCAANKKKRFDGTILFDWTTDKASDANAQNGRPGATNSEGTGFGHAPNVRLLLQCRRPHQWGPA
jgi:hypothetical protein